MENQELIMQLLDQLNNAFPERKLDQGIIETYARAFHGIDDGILSKACLQYIRTGKHFPCPAEIIELCN